MDNKKISKLRRSRGYSWEDKLVKRFNSSPNWKSFRLGSPSIALPDIVAINNIKRTIYVMEAKSGTGTTLYVPADQIIRCFHWMYNFEIYDIKLVILAFKFLSKKRLKHGQYAKRKLKEYYKICDESNIVSCTCDYNGELYYTIDGNRHALSLKEIKMPFFK
ncbi:MAG: resolvase [Thaumarchaeota archaeon]|nr:resolvase [Nitrososphaerota archaeon]MCY3975625.1 resolvase [Nitrososphaerota archaeon]